MGSNWERIELTSGYCLNKKTEEIKIKIKAYQYIGDDCWLPQWPENKVDTSGD